MTEEELRREQEEARQLVNRIKQLNSQIDKLIVDNQHLERELVDNINYVSRLIKRAAEMDKDVNQEMGYLRDKVSDADINTAALFQALTDFSNAYFIFKNIATASKNLTQFNDEYYTRFSYYNELRRITLGYVIGLDAHICSSDTMRKKVEKAYLENSNYWLSYCIAATMLWASDEEEAAERAVSKSLFLNYSNSCLYYMLINLRFSREEAARKWYLVYLNQINQDKLSDEWQYLLQTYLYGGFGSDRLFQGHVSAYFQDILTKIEAVNVGYNKKIADKACGYIESYIHKTSREFPALKDTCSQYGELIALLSAAEKNAIIAKQLNVMAETEVKYAEELPQRIEDILYDLISHYDGEELEVINKIRYNEAVVKAKGDLAAAQTYFNSNFAENANKKSLDQLLMQWAFADEKENVDIAVQQFSLSVLKKHILQGFYSFAEKYRKEEQEEYPINIDGCVLRVNEGELEAAATKLEQYYKDTRIKDILHDKYILVYLATCGASLLTLGIMAFSFSKVALVIGVLLGLAGSFLLWRRIVDMRVILEQKRTKGLNKLQIALQELKAWRESYHIENIRNADFEAALNKFDSGFNH